MKSAAAIQAIYKSYAQKILMRLTESNDQNAAQTLSRFRGAGKETPLALRLINMIQAIDPTKKSIYFNWLLNMYIQGKFNYVEDLFKAKEPLELYDKLKPTLPIEQRDISYFKTFGDFADFIEEKQGIDTRSNNQKERDKEMSMIESGAATIYKDTPDIKIIIPNTVEASAHFGRNTRWCTASIGSSYFNEYNNKGKLYILLFKKENKRFQFHFETGQFMDEKDYSISDEEKAELFQLFDRNDMLSYIYKRSPKNDSYHTAPNQKLREMFPITEADYEYIIGLNGENISLVKNPSPKLQLIAVQESISNIGYIENVDKSVIDHIMADHGITGNNQADFEAFKLISEYAINPDIEPQYFPYQFYHLLLNGPSPKNLKKTEGGKRHNTEYITTMKKRDDDFEIFQKRIKNISEDVMMRVYRMCDADYRYGISAHTLAYYFDRNKNVGDTNRFSTKIQCRLVAEKPGLFLDIEKPSEEITMALIGGKAAAHETLHLIKQKSETFKLSNDALNAIIDKWPHVVYSRETFPAKVKKEHVFRALEHVIIPNSNKECDFYRSLENDVRSHAIKKIYGVKQDYHYGENDLRRAKLDDEEYQFLEDIQLFMINKKPSSVSAFKNSSLKVQLLVLEKDIKLISAIKNPLPEALAYFVQNASLDIVDKIGSMPPLSFKNPYDSMPQVKWDEIVYPLLRHKFGIDAISHDCNDGTLTGAIENTPSHNLLQKYHEMILHSQRRPVGGGGWVVPSRMMMGQYDYHHEGDFMSPHPFLLMEAAYALSDLIRNKDEYKDEKSKALLYRIQDHIDLSRHNPKSFSRGRHAAMGSMDMIADMVADMFPWGGVVAWNYDNLLEVISDGMKDGYADKKAQTATVKNVKDQSIKPLTHFENIVVSDESLIKVNKVHKA